MELNEITVYLTEEQAKQFVLFQRYYDLFDLLLKKGVFDQKKCAITLHFDHNGVLQTIQRADFLYSKQFER